jgi:membrane protease subunit HflK
VTELNLQDARPPEEVKPAFDEVNSAQQTNERLVNEANAYAAKIVPEARGEAARVRSVSEGYKTAAVARATGDAARFNLMVAEYRNAPDVTRKRMWLDTVRDVLAGNRKIIGGDGRQLLYVPMDGQAARNAAPDPQIVAPAVSATVPAEGGTEPLPRPSREGATR